MESPATDRIPGPIRVLFNHIYEYKKGVRNLVLCTLERQYLPQAVARLEQQGIVYLLRNAGGLSVNLYFGRSECIDAIREFTQKPLNRLTPEEDFMLGALLGYDLRLQCERFSSLKRHTGIA